MQDLINNLKALGRTRLMILGGVAVGIVMALLLGISAVSSKDYAPLYKNLSMAAATSIETTLTGAGFDAQMSEEGDSVLVPRADLARARMVLAESGLPIEGDPGWELFDDASGLAMNSFMQRVNRLRAMEGELARSIQTLDGVQSARVHLVLPEREAFSRERPQPRASIIVRAVPGRTIARKQAMAIRNLVSSAVAELELGRVTVLSASGETILAEANDSDGQATLQSAKAGIEDRLAQQIQNILTARVGAGNARVRVNVDLTTAREVIVEQSFDPDQQVVRSTDNRTEQRAGTDGAGNVGVENNIPAALADPGSAASSTQSKSGENVQYEIGNTRRETVREAGDIRRVSVAVLVNGIYTADGSDVTYSERSTEELQRLSELVQTAVGFDDARGDSVSVDSLRFMDYSMEVGDPVNLSMMQRIGNNIVPILRGVLGLIIVALVMILGVRPVLRHLQQIATPELPKPEDTAALAAPEGATAETGKGGVPALPGRGAGRGPGAPLLDVSDEGRSAPGSTSVFDPESDDGPHEYIETMGVRGSLIKARVDAIQTLADEKPDEVLRVLRSWLVVEADAR
ncbi:flagellar basal-body MS-ring/collar protein FliF [Antarcticimicrobium sediminis]|uniref:Flagellar M-ring protein n=1 Tax=Antarcticimicrobium sediminis TaxID=2546227 RepID=A0A4R5EVE7_9RHOB|nr:flagellar basal-body MS-ring/collar protein FliF [Antarcticimicrobium sediminis]TDE38905.1 flagellar M-ring protein FliF [Antarcticimicrobium sediminis]